jgi:hypothetical protein
MKLTTLNSLTTPRVFANGIAKISFTKAGTVYVNRYGVIATGFKPGDKVALSQDEDNPENWYIHLDKDGFELRENSKKDNLLLNHSDLIRTFKSCFDLDFKVTTTCNLATIPEEVDGVNYFGILINQD